MTRVIVPFPGYPPYWRTLRFTARVSQGERFEARLASGESIYP